MSLWRGARQVCLVDVLCLVTLSVVLALAPFRLLMLGWTQKEHEGIKSGVGNFLVLAY